MGTPNSWLQKRVWMVFPPKNALIPLIPWRYVPQHCSEILAVRRLSQFGDNSNYDKPTRQNGWYLGNLGLGFRIFLSFILLLVRTIKKNTKILQRSLLARRKGDVFGRESNQSLQLEPWDIAPSMVSAAPKKCASETHHNWRDGLKCIGQRKVNACFHDLGQLYNVYCTSL